MTLGYIFQYANGTFKEILYIDSLSKFVVRANKILEDEKDIVARWVVKKKI